MKTLFLIPARGGSKGVPHKNIKPLGGKPLIYYTIDTARNLSEDVDICVSTDDDQIIKVVKEYGLNVPFKRPDFLATDHASSEDVIKHALDFYKTNSVNYDVIVLLQPTSPFRDTDDIKKCIEKYKSGQYDMIVSVKLATTNPYYNCFEDDGHGFLKRTISNFSFYRRQDAPDVYEYSGAVYVINSKSVLQRAMKDFTKVGFCVMDEIHSFDIDTPFDWKMAELLLKENKNNVQ